LFCNHCCYYHVFVADATQPQRVPGTGANYCETTVNAAKNLDDTITTLVKNFGEGSDYFKVSKEHVFTRAGW
jgi:hypothetical protein